MSIKPFVTPVESISSSPVSEFLRKLETSGIIVWLAPNAFWVGYGDNVGATTPVLERGCLLQLVPQGQNVAGVAVIPAPGAPPKAFWRDLHFNTYMMSQPFQSADPGVQSMIVKTIADAFASVVIAPAGALKV